MGRKNRRERKESENPDAPAILWDISSKLHGLSELLKNQGPESLLSQPGAYGIGVYLKQAATDLERVGEAL